MESKFQARAQATERTLRKTNAQRLKLYYENKTHEAPTGLFSFLSNETSFVEKRRGQEKTIHTRKL